MNVIAPASLYGAIALWLVIGLAVAVAANYFLRPRTRALYPGGAGRYLLALSIQAAGFIIPIPLVLLLTLGPPTPDMLDVALAVGAGIAVIYLLRMLPATGPLLKDLHRARLEAVMQRLGPRT